MKRHIQTPTGKFKLQCQACKEYFITKVELRRHEKTHEEKVDKPYSCIDCQKSDITHIAANSCEQIHTKLFKCVQCE